MGLSQEIFELCFFIKTLGYLILIFSLSACHTPEIKSKFFNNLSEFHGVKLGSRTYKLVTKKQL